jgi:hypothetical protein
MFAKVESGIGSLMLKKELFTNLIAHTKNLAAEVETLKADIAQIKAATGVVTASTPTAPPFTPAPVTPLAVVDTSKATA